MKEISEIIEERRDTFCALADRIWGYAELGMGEHKSVADYAAVCSELGFEVNEGVCGMPTAFTASAGDGGMTVGFLGEYDALSGLSQEAGADEHKPIVEGGAGHGCGHNLLGVGSLAAAWGLKEYLRRRSLPGRVIFFGCPGEESGSGKAFMARDGLYDGLDFALSWHPDDRNEVWSGTSNSCVQKEYRFKGVAAHAASAPEQGRSALDAVTLMNVGVQFLREHMPADARVHYAVTDPGGQSPNVVQADAAVTYMIRDIEVNDCLALTRRVDDIARGAALMTGTELSERFIDALSNLCPNFTLEKVLQQAMIKVGAPKFTDAELAEAAALAKSFGSPQCYPDANIDEGYFAELAGLKEGETKSLCDFVLPLRSRTTPTLGSTDVGDASRRVPTGQLRGATAPVGTPAHSWQMVACGKSGYAKKSMVFMAKSLALAAAELLDDPVTVAKARAEFERRMAAAGGYVCPLPADAEPANMP